MQPPTVVVVALPRCLVVAAIGRELQELSTKLVKISALALELGLLAS